MRVVPKGSIHLLKTVIQVRNAPFLGWSPLGRGEDLTIVPAWRISFLASREMRRSVGHFKHFTATSRGEMRLVPKGFVWICP